MRIEGGLGGDTEEVDEEAAVGAAAGGEAEEGHAVGKAGGGEEGRDAVRAEVAGVRQGVAKVEDRRVASLGGRRPGCAEEAIMEHEEEEEGDGELHGERWCSGVRRGGGGKRKGKRTSVVWCGRIIYLLPPPFSELMFCYQQHRGLPFLSLPFLSFLFFSFILFFCVRLRRPSPLAVRCNAVFYFSFFSFFLFFKDRGPLVGFTDVVCHRYAEGSPRSNLERTWKGPQILSCTGCAVAAPLTVRRGTLIKHKRTK